MSLTFNHQNNQIVAGSSNPTNNNSTSIDLGLNSGGLKLPQSSTSERDINITAPVAGMVRFNTTTNVLEQFDGTSWGSISANLVSGTGFITSDGVNNYFRTITGSNGIVVSNSSGTSGNPEVSLDATVSNFNNITYSNGSSFERGDILVANASSGFTAINLGIRNILPAGDIGKNPWQYGTSFPNVAAGNWMTADRFLMGYQNNAGLNAQHTVTRSTDVPSILQAGEFLGRSIQLNLVSPLNSLPANCFVGYRIPVEGFDLQKIYGRPFVVDFWAKAAKPGRYYVSSQTNSVPVQICYTPVDISVANTWTRCVAKFPAMPVAAYGSTGSAYGMIIRISLATNVTGSGSNTWSTNSGVAGIDQVNGVDSTSTSFSLTGFKLYSSSEAVGNLSSYSLQQVEDFCLRHYETGGSQDVPALCNWGVGSDYRNSWNIRFRIEKRVLPNIRMYDPVTLTPNQIRNYTTGTVTNLAGAVLAYSTQGFLPFAVPSGAAADNLIGCIWTADAAID